MKHLITGGAGFIGYHLASALADRGDDVHLIDNFGRGRLDDGLARLLALPNVTLDTADLTDPRAFEHLADDYDAVYHLAAVVGVRNVTEGPDRVLAVNARAVLNLLDWFTRTPGGRLLFASTSETYAWTATFHQLPIPTPEDVPLSVDRIDNARATYALSKVFGEMAVLHACTRVSKPYTIVRYHNVYGPRMGMDHVIPELYRRVYDQQTPLTVYSPDESRAFCYISDAVEASLRLMVEGVPSAVYNVGNDREEVTIRELGEMVLQCADRAGTPIEARSRGVPGIARRCPDISRVTAATGYEPVVSLHDGLRLTTEWYRHAFDSEKLGGERTGQPVRT